MVEIYPCNWTPVRNGWGFFYLQFRLNLIWLLINLIMYVIFHKGYIRILLVDPQYLRNQSVFEQDELIFNDDDLLLLNQILSAEKPFIEKPSLVWKIFGKMYKAKFLGNNDYGANDLLQALKYVLPQLPTHDLGESKELIGKIELLLNGQMISNSGTYLHPKINDKALTIKAVGLKLPSRGLPMWHFYYNLSDMLVL
jgi:hypothetical protein